MSKNPTEEVSRRKALRATATAASIPGLALLGSESVAASTSITFYLYPGEDDDMSEYTQEAKEEMRDDFAPQLADIGVDLSVYERGQVPDYVDELMGDYQGTFEHYVKEEIYSPSDGSALHMWFNTEDTDGANTPGGSLVDGDGEDAFSDMSMNYYQYSGFSKRRNMYFHEALHALMEEGEYGFACGSHSENDDEHTCGEIDKYVEYLPGDNYEYLEVTPMATSYDDSPDELGDACDSLPDDYPDNRDYVPDFSDCTMDTLDNFFTYNYL